VGVSQVDGEKRREDGDLPTRPDDDLMGRLWGWRVIYSEWKGRGLEGKMRKEAWR
jgi:hypothetical protein